MFCLNEYPELIKHSISSKVRKNIIFPIIGELEIRNAQTVHFSEIRSQLLVHYSRFTCWDVMNNLNVLFQYACSEGLIKKNPITHAQIRMEGRDVSTQRECKVLSDEQIDRINMMIPFCDNKDLLSLVFTTGINQSSLRALKWDDVDLGSGELYVIRKLSRSGNVRKEKTLPPEKMRIMQLPQFVTDYLIERFDRMQIARAFNPAYNEGNYIFSSRTGKPMDRGCICKSIHDLGTMAGIEELTYSDLMYNSLNNAIKCNISINNIMDYYNCANNTEYLKEIYMNKQVRKACNE